MKVALVGPVYPYRGGIAHYTTLLARHLGEKHLVEVISFRRQYPGWLFPGRSDKDTSQQPLLVEKVHYDLDPLDPVSWWHTAKRLSAIKPDLLVLQWWVTFWAPSFSCILFLFRHWASSPVAILCHNVLPHETHWWDHLLAKTVLSLGTYHLVHSTQDRLRLLDLLPDARVTVLRFPAYGEVAVRRGSKREARCSLGVDPETPVLLFFGFVRPYKGLRYLLQAMATVCRHVAARLFVVGEFWDNKERYVKLISELALESQVTIIDRYVPNEELGLYLAAADVVVLPYVETSQSAAARLALDAGVPVIASRVGGLREMIADGVNGLLVEPCDAQSLARAIVHYFETGLRSHFEGNRCQCDDAGWEEVVSVLEKLAAGSQIPS